MTKTDSLKGDLQEHVGRLSKHPRRTNEILEDFCSSSGFRCIHEAYDQAGKQLAEIGRLAEQRCNTTTGKAALRLNAALRQALDDHEIRQSSDICEFIARVIDLTEDLQPLMDLRRVMAEQTHDAVKNHETLKGRSGAAGSHRRYDAVKSDAWHIAVVLLQDDDQQEYRWSSLAREVYGILRSHKRNYRDFPASPGTLSHWQETATERNPPPRLPFPPGGAQKNTEIIPPSAGRGGFFPSAESGTLRPPKP